MRFKHRQRTMTLFLPPECRHPVHYGCEHDTARAPAEPLQSRTDSRAAADIPEPRVTGEIERPTA